MAKPEPGGLFAQGQRVPLRGVRIDVRATGVAARVTVAQRYENREKVPVEAVYSFPLEESSAVCGFEVEIGGKKVVGRVGEREAAFEKYDRAMAEGHGAFLMDQDRPNIFTASVGNLLPGQEAVVRISYVTELEQSGDAIRLLIPTTISPRYIPPEEIKKMDPAELDHIAPPTVLGGVPYGLELSVEMQAPADVREVSCPSHPASVSMSGRTVKVALMGQNIQLDQDFVLNVALARPHEASAVVARDGDGVRAVMVNLFPDLSGIQRGPCEFFFIIDRSGSMEGPSIQQARAALLLALRSLEEGDRFNIVGFGSRYDPMFRDSVLYSQQSLDEAVRKVERMKADLGGTELLQPLQFATGAPLSGELPRQIVLLTDGQVGNETQCIELATAHAARCRLFTFGIGHGVSEHLLRSLARATGGQAEFIHPNERIEPKVMKQFRRMASANLRNVRVEWGGLKTDLLAPSEIPPLFDGDRLTLYARVIGGAPTEVAVVADSPKGELRFPVKVDLERAVDDPAIPVLMARKAIQELEEGRGMARGSAQTNRKDKAVNAHILELALRYQLMSSVTSFVAVEERPAGEQTQPAELRRIPVALTKGWGGAGEVVLCQMGGAAGPPVMAQAMRCSVASAPPASFAVAEEAAFAPASSKVARQRAAAKGGVLSSLARGIFGKGQDAEAMEAPATFALPPGDALLALTALQRADGSFELQEALAKAAQRTLAELEKAAKALNTRDHVARTVLATALAIEILEKQFSDRRDEWQMIADKAKRWLAKQNVPPPAGLKDLLEWARSVVG